MSVGSVAVGDEVGGSFQALGPCQTQATLSLPGTYTFAWSYMTADPAGPGGDAFGVIVDSNRIQISDPGGASAQSGTRSFTAASTFGWFMNCTDCIGGSATAAITQVNFAAAVPEPETYALFAAGLVGLAARLKRRRTPASATA